MRYTIVPKALVPKFFRIICAKEIRLGPEAIHYATRLKKEVSAERIRKYRDFFRKMNFEMFLRKIKKYRDFFEK